MAGKADWLANGLPTEGEKATVPRAKDLLRTDVTTCGLDDRIGDVRKAVEASPYGLALVTSDSEVVLGVLAETVLEGDADGKAEEAMENGPSTVRADLALDELVERLRKRDSSTAIVTAPDGRLLGIVLREEAAQ